MNSQLENTSTRLDIPAVAESLEDQRAQPMLVVMHGSLLGMSYLVGEAPLRIGRMSTCEIPIDDDNVSRQHAEIIERDNEIWLRDLESTNGTIVNSRRITETVLRDGDLILIGRVLFKFIRSNTIENRFFGQMYALATTDFLTGIFNRQHILSRLESEFARSRRYLRPLTIVSYDVDHFKQINDSFGHLAGDQLLIESSRLISQNVRQQDFYGRLGGDEFLILCPETDLNNTVLMAQRLAQLIGKWSYVYQSRKLDFSVSMGVATLTDEIRTPAELLARADDNLYRSKHRGKNHISF